MTYRQDPHKRYDREPSGNAARSEAPASFESSLARGTARFDTSYGEDDSEESDAQRTLIWEGSTAEELAVASAAQEVTRALNVEDLAEIAPARTTPEPSSDPHAWFAGRSFGGFQTVCALASGGMATVFLARKEGPARVSKHAAIKVVHPHLALEREFIDMFLDEARIAALIDHPNVCRVLDFGMAEGTYYLAMEYVLGETWSTVRAALAEHSDGARIVPAISAHVLAQACEGLHAAHEAVDDQGHPLRIVHRDISPQNIFVAFDGTVRVLDFGIARAADRITSTRDGILKGRLAYMSPEQMSLGEVGPAADIWSMGVVLREALEGRRLFRRATDAETMLAVTTESLPAWHGDVPPALRAIADRALAREPRRRFASAREMATALTHFASTVRTPVGTSELSVWMGLLFAAQMEQKRALLQLPVRSQPSLARGTARFDTSVSTLPPAQLHEDRLEDSGLSDDAAPVTAFARAQKRRGAQRPRWFNASALLALGSLGAIGGLLLGRIARTPTLRSSVALVEATPTPTAAPIPSISQLAAPEAQEAAAGGAARGSVDRDERATESDSRARAAIEARGPAHDRTADGPTDRARSRHAAEQRDKDEQEHPQPTEPEPVGESGTVLVAFENGWAEVYLGKRLLGTTPARFSLPPGKHVLNIRPFGTGKAFQRRTEVASGAVVKLFLASPEP